MIKLPDAIKKVNILDTLFIGKVIDNNDPEKLGRVKVDLPIWNSIPTEDLPWVYLLKSTLLGGKSNTSSFSVPEVGTYVVVKFEKDVYHPFYIGEIQNYTTHQPIFDTNYPNSYGFIDSIGNQFVIDKNSKTIKVTHNSGTTIIIQQDGTIEINSVANKNITVSGNTNITTSGDTNITTTGTTNITSQGQINVKGNIVNIDGGSGNLAGAVTQQCICAFLGLPHIDASSDVNISK